MIALLFCLKIRIAEADYQNVLTQTHVVNDFFFQRYAARCFSIHMSYVKSNLKGCGGAS